MDIQILTETLASFGLPGLLAALLILIAVYAAKRAGIVATGNHARIANMILSAILYGLGDNPKAEAALLATISSILAGLAYEGIRWLDQNVSHRAQV